MSASRSSLVYSFRTDPPADWDDFVMACDPSHFEQTSWWANVESADGWSSRYVVGRVGGSIAAGAMMLVRRQARIGKVGYIFRGPLLRKGLAAPNEVRTHLIAGIIDISRGDSLVLLVVAPPYDSDELAHELCDRGFLVHPPTLPPRGLPTGALTIDLLQDRKELERAYRHTLRKQVRRANKKGVKVLLGSAEALDDFWSRHMELCRRRGVASNVPGLEYVRRIWQEFHRRGRAWMFNAVLEDVVLCSLICLGAGKWFYAWRIGWSPDSEKAYPTQAAFARAIETAAEAGFHYFDFMGIDWDEAVRIERGEHPNTPTSGMTFFKLGFGGTVRKLPATLAWYPNPVLRSLMRSVGYRILSSRRSQRWIGRPRHSGPG